MIPVDEAHRLISSCTQDFGTEKLPLLRAIGRVSAEPVKADRDMPPYHRVMMDGIAISSASFEAGKKKFIIENMAAAGSPLQSLQHQHHCIEVMTGAILPSGTDAVIPYEQLLIKDSKADIIPDSIVPFQNIHQQARDAKKGDLLLKKNIRLSPAHLSVMATVGIYEPQVYRLPSVAVCSTGDELVAVEQTPLPHQVRQSNVYFITADLIKENIEASLHHLPDNKDEMTHQLQDILQNIDVILLSGAVSKGKRDYLPEVLNGLGMQTLFHNVAQRPGKPFLLGTINHKMIFGFPGNPVSTFVCYHLFFKAWLMQSIHQQPPVISARLKSNIMPLPSLTLHVLVKLIFQDGSCFAAPIGLSSSGDIPALLEADGIISLPAGTKMFQQGEVVEVRVVR